MLVDVVELRHLDVKLTREEVQAAVPVRGELSLTEARAGWYQGQKSPPLMAGLVAPGRLEWALAPLDPAFVRKVKNGSMLILGKQQYSRSGRDKDIRSYRQAWWCRIVYAGDTTQEPAPLAALHARSKELV